MTVLLWCCLCAMATLRRGAEHEAWQLRQTNCRHQIFRLPRAFGGTDEYDVVGSAASVLISRCFTVARPPPLPLPPLHRPPLLAGYSAYYK